MDGPLLPAPDCLASIERAVGELQNAARCKAGFPASFLAATYTGFAVEHLRRAARVAPRPHRMRLARLAAGLRMEMRHTGRAPAAPSLTVDAMIAGEVADAIRHRQPKDYAEAVSERKAA